MKSGTSTKLLKIKLDPIQELPHDVPFDPVEVVWCRYGFGIEDAPGSGPSIQIQQLEMTAERYARSISSPGEIAAIAAQIARNPATTGWRSLQPPDQTQYKPTDIGVTRQCYVVIELKPDRNWRFITDDGGLTTDGNYHPGNCALRHVDNNGNSPAPNPPVPANPWPTDCRVVYFSLVRRAAAGQPGDRHKFNFHIEMINGDLSPPRTYAVGIIIDPDIGNTGNQPIPYP